MLHDVAMGKSRVQSPANFSPSLCVHTSRHRLPCTSVPPNLVIPLLLSSESVRVWCGPKAERRFGLAPRPSVVINYGNETTSVQSGNETTPF